MPILMGIVNCTPDSFYSGGRAPTSQQAIAQAEAMIAAGATILDIGGESTRPGAKPVPTSEQLRRVLPTIRAIRAHHQIDVSIDTSDPAVMTEAIEAGATWINDTRALQQPGALDVAIASGAKVCLMHMQGQPDTMQIKPHYPNDDVTASVLAWFKDLLTAYGHQGLKPDQIIVDPGFGFGKTIHHNWAMLNQLGRFKTLNCPILVGVSHKSMFQIVPHARETHQRAVPSLAAAALAVSKGANIIRTHDVPQTLQAIHTAWLMQQEGLYEPH